MGLALSARSISSFVLAVPAGPVVQHMSAGALKARWGIANDENCNWYAMQSEVDYLLQVEKGRLLRQTVTQQPPSTS